MKYAVDETNCKRLVKCQLGQQLGMSMSIDVWYTEGVYHK